MFVLRYFFAVPLSNVVLLLLAVIALQVIPSLRLANSRPAGHQDLSAFADAIDLLADGDGLSVGADRQDIAVDRLG